MSLKIESNPISLKRVELVNLINHFRTLGKYSGEKFTAFYSKNLHKLEAKAKAFQKHIEELRPTGEETEAYAKAEEKLFAEFSKKGPDGKPIMRGQFSYDIDETRRKEFDVALKELRESEEHKVAWGVIEKFDKDHKEYMQGDTDFEPHRIYEKNLPETFTGNDRYPIEEFIVENTED